MSTTSRWRRTAGFKLVCLFLCALTSLAPATAAAWPTAQRAIRPTPNITARAAISAPPLASTASAVVPRRIRPQALDVLSGPDGDPWSWFDGDPRPGFGGGVVRVRATLPTPTRLIAVAFWGGAAGKLTISVERDGKSEPVEGLTAIDTAALSDGWHSFAAVNGGFARTLVLEWQSRGDSPRELELWGLGAAPGAPPPDTELADQLHLGVPAGAVELVASPALAQIVPPAHSSVALTVELASEPRAFERAFLVYELRGVPHFSFVPRRLNGQPGPVPRSADEIGPEPGDGGLQVEEIAPDWLHRGPNVLEFAPIAGRSYVVGNARIVLVPAVELLARGEAMARDAELTLRTPAQPQFALLRVAKPADASVVLRAGTEAVKIDLAGMAPGWH